MFDERYSSSSAAALMSGSKQQAVTRDLDAVSACVILSHFCKVGGEGAEEVLLDDKALAERLLREHDELMEERARIEKERLLMNTMKESRGDMIKRIKQEEKDMEGKLRGLSRKEREKMKKQRKKKSVNKKRLL